MTQLTEHAPLLGRNTFGMDVRCALLAEYETLDDLRWVLSQPQVQQLMQAERAKGRPAFWHIGAGSNLLFTGDYPGLVLHCAARGIEIARNEIEDYPLDYLGPTMECMVEVQAGTTWDDVCAWAVERDLYGIENLSLIPGEMGAAVVQNIGAYGVELKDVIELVNCYDVETDSVCTFSVRDLDYGYRASWLKQPGQKGRYIVLNAMLRLSHTPHLQLEYAGLRAALPQAEPTLADVRQTVINIRRAKLPEPEVLGNAGSFFKNPVVMRETYEQLLSAWRADHGAEATVPHYDVDAQHVKVPAGWLIEQCGWRGRSLGRAGVYEKQCLVLVNLCGATPDEVVKLCHQVVADVRQRFGIDIEPEVNLIES